MSCFGRLRCWANNSQVSWNIVLEFHNVDEILHTGKSASATGIWLLAQLSVAKVVATALCKGSGLVGGLYAPSLMIGAAVGAVFGGSAGELINPAIPGNAAIAEPQAYALVEMAATFASVCSVPLTSVLLLFELTRDYRILLPLTINSCTVSSIFTRGISYRGRACGFLICYPDTDLAMAKQLMEAKEIKQLPVVKRSGVSQREKKCRIVAILFYDSIWNCVRDELNSRKSINQLNDDDSGMIVATKGHQ